MAAAGFLADLPISYFSKKSETAVSTTDSSTSRASAKNSTNFSEKSDSVKRLEMMLTRDLLMEDILLFASDTIYK